MTQAFQAKRYRVSAPTLATSNGLVKTTANIGARLASTKPSIAGADQSEEEE
jgi:hypothetical protein